MRNVMHTIARVSAGTALMALAACGREQLTAPSAIALARGSTPAPDVTIVQLGEGVLGARDINNSGLVVGDGFTWSARDGLQTLPKSGVCEPSVLGVNDRGDAVGVGSPACAGSWFAMVWTAAGELIQLPTISILHAINNRGEAVGAAGGAVVWTADAGVRYLPGGSVALDVNERGDVVGQSAGLRAALWPRGGELVTLPTPSGESFATAINDQRDVVGFIGRHFTSQGFVWSERDGLRMLETPAGWYSHPEDINNRGDIVGWIKLAADPTVPGIQHAVLWPAAGGLIDLGGLTPDADAAAYGINNRGDVVGSSDRGERGVVFPVLWRVRGGAPE